MKNTDTVPRETLASQLTQAVRRFLPDLPDRVVEVFAKHFVLLCEWNATHNITRITDPESAALLHYVDSLCPLRLLNTPLRVVDIGSGTGLPGIAAAAWWPSSHVVLVEASAKKVSFLRSFRALLDHSNIEIIQGRCELIAPQEADLLLVRATFKWPELPGLVARHLAPGGRLLAYLGSSAPAESEWKQAALTANLVDAGLKKYWLPGEKQTRHSADAKKE